MGNLTRARAASPSHAMSVSDSLRLVTADLAAQLAALADPTRREIFERLAEDPCPVGRLAEQVPVSRPAVSQHLKVLKDAGLVSDERHGTQRIYHLNPDGVGSLRAYLDTFWVRSLHSYKAAIEPTPEEDEHA